MTTESPIPSDEVIESLTNAHLEHMVAVAQAELNRRAAVAEKGTKE